jgi:pimeloyl-ACP methyl ester carboxylesterase
VRAVPAPHGAHLTHNVLPVGRFAAGVPSAAQGMHPQNGLGQMKYRNVYLFLFLLWLPCRYGYPQQNTETAIDAVETVKLGNSQQKIYIRTTDISNPVVLYIHGGPAEPIIAISHYFTDTLMRSCTFIGWDQRGCGLSYSPTTNYAEITEQQLVNDAVELTKLLLERFGKKKIFLIGHSFGSIIGYRLVTEYPQYYHGYIGVGQVIDWESSNAAVKAWLREEMWRAGDISGLEKLNESRYPDISLVRRYGGILHAEPDYERIVRSSKYYYEGYPEHVNRSREAVSANISRNPSTFSFLRRKSVKVPVRFFVGFFDHTPASSKEVTERFYEELQAPSKEIVWFYRSAHLPNIEEPQKFQNEVIRFLSSTLHDTCRE